MRKLFSFPGKVIRLVRIYFLKKELHYNEFSIGGYNDKMVRVNGRWLKGWEVAKVHKWRDQGKIAFVVRKVITYSGIRFTFKTNLFIFKKGKDNSHV